MIRYDDEYVSLSAHESGEKPGTYEVYLDSRIILEFKKNRKGVIINKNELGITDDDLRLHLEAYIDDMPSLLYHIAKIRARAMKRFERILRKTMGYFDEETLMDLFRRMKYMEDIHK